MFERKTFRIWVTIISAEMKLLLAIFAVQVSVFTVVNSAGSPLPSSALFVLGDSLFDAGNNNYIKTTLDFRSNFTPYGETFFHFPTGRFSDGRIIPDFIAEYAKLPLIPPYLDPHNNQYIYGVNFASGGAGTLLDINPTKAIGIHTQVKYFKNVKEYLKKELGEGRAERLISNSVFLLSFGANEYFAQFGIDTTGNQNYTETQLVNFVIGNITSALKELYKRGGRKFAYMSLSPLGCTPHMRMLKGDKNGSCLDEASSLSRLNNKLMLVALKNLAIQLKGFKYTIFDSYSTFLQRMQNPSKYGFKDVRTACCGSKRFRGLYNCGGMSFSKEYELCENPNDYLFFDAYHPTEKGFEQLAKLMWSGNAQVMKPYNLKQLFEYETLLASE